VRPAVAGHHDSAKLGHRHRARARRDLHAHPATIVVAQRARDKARHEGRR
jgi:hypothetical protein